MLYLTQLEVLACRSNCHFASGALSMADSQLQTYSGSCSCSFEDDWHESASVMCRLQVPCQNSISRCHIQWLGLHAFHAVLTRKQSAYKVTVAKLQEDMQLPRYKHLKAQLANVVAPSRSLCFQDIQF